MNILVNLRQKHQLALEELKEELNKFSNLTFGEKYYGNLKRAKKFQKK